MPLWNYNPIDAWNDFKGGWNKLEDLAVQAYKTPIVSKQTFNEFMDTNPIDVANWVKTKYDQANQALFDYRKGDAVILPTKDGNPITKPKVDFNSLKYLVKEAEMRKAEQNR